MREAGIPCDNCPARPGERKIAPARRLLFESGAGERFSRTPLIRASFLERGGTTKDRGRREGEDTVESFLSMRFAGVFFFGRPVVRLSVRPSELFVLAAAKFHESV